MRVFIPVLARDLHAGEEITDPIMQFKAFDRSCYDDWIRTLTRKEQAKRWTAIPRKKKTT